MMLDISNCGNNLEIQNFECPFAFSKIVSKLLDAGDVWKNCLDMDNDYKCRHCHRYAAAHGPDVGVCYATENDFDMVTRAKADFALLNDRRECLFCGKLIHFHPAPLSTVSAVPALTIDLRLNKCLFVLHVHIFRL
jgi:hypothetical protein